MTRLRRAASSDAPELAALFRHVWRASLPFLPVLHTPEEDRGFFGRAIKTQTVWVADDGAALIGFAAAAPGWLNHLYVDPEWQGRAVGSALLDAAVPADEVRLWCFQQNARARRFYERHGFTIERETDGSGNEEREPGILYVRPAR